MSKSKAAEDPIAFDSWEDAKAAVSKSEDDRSFVIVGFIHAWSPVAMYSGKILDGLRRAGDLSFAKVFILDADINTKEYFEDVETFSTPSLAFFAGGKAMKIHQPGKKLATALPGQLTKAQVTEISRFAHEIARSGNDVVRCEL